MKLRIIMRICKKQHTLRNVYSKLISFSFFSQFFFFFFWLVIITTIFQVGNTLKSRYQNEHDYYDFEPEGPEAEVDSLAEVQKPSNLVYNGNGNGVTDSMFSGTTCSKAVTCSI